MDALADVIDELVVARKGQDPNIQAPPRKRRAISGQAPIAVVPAAPIPNTASQLNGVIPTKPAGAADDAMKLTTTIAPAHRRQSKGAVRLSRGTQKMDDSAQGQATGFAHPNRSPPDPSLATKPKARGRRSGHRAAAAPLSDGRQHGDAQVQHAARGNDGARTTAVTHYPESPVIAEITQLWRMRQRWHRAEKSLILQGRALCRAWTEGDKEAANKLFDRIAKGEAIEPTLAMALMPFLKAIENFQPERKAIEKRLTKLAQTLPVWAWANEVKGFGAMTLAGLTGECGDIGSYRSPAALWKRMGLAVIGTERQRRVPGEEALLHGYSPQRRCLAYLFGDSLIKAGAGCRYRPVYDARKAYELARTDHDKPKSQGHAHNRAARYMTKRVLRDLWAAWRTSEKAMANVTSEPSLRKPSSRKGRATIPMLTRSRQPAPSTLAGAVQ